MKASRRIENHVVCYLLLSTKNKAKSEVDDDEPPTKALKKWRGYNMEFHFHEPLELTLSFSQLIGVTFSYPNKEDFKLSDVGSWY